MKRLVFFTITLCLCLTACSNTKNKTDVILDYVEYETVEELNSIAGTHIVVSNSEDKSNEEFGLITGTIAQYTFNIGDEKWCVRGSKDTENDISGLYYDDIKFEKNITSTYYNSEVYVLRFFDGDVQYVITLKLPKEGASTSYFDKTCNYLKTKITGIKAGYDVEIVEDGDNVINRTTYYNNDNTITISEVVYSFKENKMVSIKNNTIFASEEIAKDYYDQLLLNGGSKDKLILNGKIISLDKSENLEFYSDYTKEMFIEQMQATITE